MNRRRWRMALSVAGAVLAGTLAFSIGSAWAHGEAEIKVKSDTAAPGGTITIQGEGFGQGDTVTILLEGADSKLELGSVEAHGDDGKFVVSLHVPDSAPVGRYTVRASAKDKKAETGITLMGAGAKGPGMEEQMQELVPYRRWPERAGLIGVALAVALVGYLLLRERAPGVESRPAK